jgi:hypothetical protein
MVPAAILSIADHVPGVDDATGVHCVPPPPPSTPASNDTSAPAPRPSLSDCVRHAMGYHCRRWNLRCVARVIRAEPDAETWRDVSEDLERTLRGDDGWRMLRMLTSAAGCMSRGQVMGAVELLAEWAELDVDAWVAEQRESIAQDGCV